MKIGSKSINIFWTLVLMISWSNQIIFSQQVEVQGELKVTEMTPDDTQENLVIRNSDGTLGTRSAASLPPPPPPIDTSRNLASDFELAKHLCECQFLPPFLIRSLLESGYTEAELIESGIPLSEIQNASPIIDGDGNEYTSITIGTQTWLRENLKTTSTINGTAITMGTTSTWNNLGSNETPAYSLVNNSNAYTTEYGLLYNWYAVETDDICPIGYRIPTISESQTLDSHLGSSDAILVKEKGFEYWIQPNQLSVNSSGFSARGSGYRNDSGSYTGYNNRTRWWTLTENSNPDFANSMIIWYLTNDLSTSSSFNKGQGQSIRCLKN